jgi:hypothetical protein
LGASTELQFDRKRKRAATKARLVADLNLTRGFGNAAFGRFNEKDIGCKESSFTRSEPNVANANSPLGGNSGSMDVETKKRPAHDEVWTN